MIYRTFASKFGALKARGGMLKYLGPVLVSYSCNLTNK